MSQLRQLHSVFNETSQRKSGEQEEVEDNWSDDELLSQQLILDPEEARNKFQDSPTVVTSKDTMQGGGLNLAVKRAKHNDAGPFTKPTKIKWGGGSKDKTQPIQKLPETRVLLLQQKKINHHQRARQVQRWSHYRLQRLKIIQSQNQKKYHVKHLRKQSWIRSIVKT